MSLEMCKNTMKLTYWLARESRRDRVRLGISSSLKKRRVLETKDNRCYAPDHRHGGVCVVGMLGSDSETSREILVGAEGRECPQNRGQAWNREFLVGSW